jgi:hypothetical protein
VWGGTAPDWVKNIDGPALISRPEPSVDRSSPLGDLAPLVDRDYVDAWNGAERWPSGYDSNPWSWRFPDGRNVGSDERFIPLRPPRYRHRPAPGR